MNRSLLAGFVTGLFAWAVLRSVGRRLAVAQPAPQPEYDPYAYPFGEVVTISDASWQASFTVNGPH